MKTAFLVYRPVMDYEESMTPYRVFTTLNAAERFVKAFREWGTAAVDGMPEWPEDAEQGSDEWDASFDAREAYVRNLQPPWGIELRFGDIGVHTTSFDPNCIDIMELPLNATLRSTKNAQ